MPRRQVACLWMLLVQAGCYGTTPSRGGGQQSKFEGVRKIIPADVALPPEYRIEAVARDLTFPTDLTFDDHGRAYVIESGYCYGERWTTPRLLTLNPNGQVTEVARGDDKSGPWNGVTFHDGHFYVSESGHGTEGGRIVRIDRDGKQSVILDKLPSLGDHHTNQLAFHDGWIYFGQGTATNSGVVGVDNFEFGWLKRHPDFHDIPAKDVRLTGQNFTTDNPLTPVQKDLAITGAYLPFGTQSQAGQVIHGQLPCTSAILRVRPDGSKLEMVAWGLRNPYGLTFAPDGTLYVTENSYDVRGSRPVWGTGDVLWRIEPGLWYGWPDFHGDQPLTRSDHYTAPGKPSPHFLLAEHPNPPPRPAAKFGVHSSSNGIAFAPGDGKFGYAGEAFVAQFGDMSPKVGKVMSPVGFKVVRVDVKTGVTHDFAANTGLEGGPASRHQHGGLERPTAVRFSPDGSSLFVVDFGVLEVAKEITPFERTGVVWRITREGQR